MTDLTIGIPPYPPPAYALPKRRAVTADEVYAIARTGMVMTHLAHYLGMSVPALAKRMEEDAELKSAYLQGLSELVARSGKLLSDAVDKGDTKAAMFILARRGGWPLKTDVKTSNTPAGAAPTIDSHVLDMAAAHSALLDSPDPDAVDAEWSEAPATAPTDEPSAEELAAMLE